MRQSLRAVIRWRFSVLFASERAQLFFFASLSTAIILLLVEIPIERFIVETERKVIPEQDEYYIFTGDYNHDGNSEFFYCRNDMISKRFTLNVYDHRNQIIEAISFANHEWTNDLYPAIHDLDGNGISEFVYLTVLNDSVLLNAIDLTRFASFMEPVFLGVIERKVPQRACHSQFFHCGDKDGDGNNELYFFFDSGYGLYPRGLFRFDYFNRKIYKTPKSYISWMSPEFADINADGTDEILGVNYAPDNVPFETEYSDDRPYIGAFNLKLEYLFPPIPMNKGYGSVTTQPAVFSDTVFIALHNNLSANTDSLCVYFVSNNGEIIRRKCICNNDESTQRSFLKIVDNRNYLFIGDYGKMLLTPGLEHVTQNLNDKKGRNRNDINFHQIWEIDADNDGNKEHVVFVRDNSTFKIINPKSGNITEFATATRESVMEVYPFMNNFKVEKLLVTTTNGYFFILYSENRLYWLKYMTWLGVFLTALLITHLIQYTQKRRMEARWANEKQLIELQFNTIRNQLNPHFIFNALNSVGYLIEKGRKEEAYDYLSVNSRMIRKVLEDAETSTRPLEEEIRFVKDYLVIQEFRFQDRFRTQFYIDDKVNLQIAVPKMVLHTYVENAVKHGFKNTLSDGLLEIRIAALAKGVQIIISDNGRPSVDKADKTESTGKGLQIMEAYYRLFEKQYHCKIESAITDKSVLNPRESGYEVVISIQY